MIHIAAILPTSCYQGNDKTRSDTTWYPHYATNRPFHMALAHNVLEKSEHCQLFRTLTAAERFVILDNSLWENGHKAINFDDSLRAAEMINASEIVLPDVWLDGEATVHSAYDHIWMARNYNYSHPLTKFAAVVQGTTKEEWLKCYTRLLQIEGIHTIHIPKVMDKYWPGGRVALLHYLDATRQVSLRHDYHLLGIWHDPIELAACKKLTWIRSCDTALPGHAAYYHVELGPLGLPYNVEKTKRPEGYFNLTFNGYQLDKLRINLEVMDGYTK